MFALWEATLSPSSAERHKANIQVARQLFGKGQVALADLLEASLR
jgi:hypothetical protein